MLSLPRSLVCLVPLVLLGCDSSYLEIFPYEDSTVGQGLLVGHRVKFTECRATLGEDDCTSGDLSIESVSLSDGLELIDQEETVFRVRAQSLGEQRAKVTTTRGKVSVSMNVVEVLESLVYLNRDTLIADLEPDAIRYLTNSTIGIEQEHRGEIADDWITSIRGTADFIVDSTIPDAAYQVSESGILEFIWTGSSEGSVMVSTSVGGELPMQVVPDEAIAEFQFWRAEPDERVEVLQVGKYKVGAYLVPMTADSHIIVGTGYSEPEIRVEPDSLFDAHIGEPTAYDLYRRISIERLLPGEGTLTVSWGGITVEVALADPAAD
jgi:hypothetical protein